MLSWINSILNKKPLSAQIYLTYRCTSRCSICNFWKYSKKELTLKQIIKIIDNLVKFGIKIITLTGGDVLLRKDFKDILDYLKQKKVSVIVGLNGLIMNERILNILNSYNKCKVIFSLDSLDKKRYKTIRGVDRLDKVLENILYFRKKVKYVPRIFMTITKINYDEIFKIFNFCKKNKISFTCCPYLHSEAGEWVSDDTRLVLDKKIIKKVSNDLKKLAKFSKKEKYLFSFSEYYKLCANVVEGKKGIPCGAGYDVISISPKGNVSVCPNLPGIGNIFKENLNEIYKKNWKKLVKACYNDLPCALSCTHQLMLIKKYPFKFLFESITSGKIWDYLKII